MFAVDIKLKCGGDTEIKLGNANDATSRQPYGNIARDKSYCVPEH